MLPQRPARVIPLPCAHLEQHPAPVCSPRRTAPAQHGNWRYVHVRHTTRQRCSRAGPHASAGLQCMPLSARFVVAVTEPMRTCSPVLQVAPPSTAAGDEQSAQHAGAGLPGLLKRQGRCRAALRLLPSNRMRGAERGGMGCPAARLAQAHRQAGAPDDGYNMLCVRWLVVCPDGELEDFNRRDYYDATQPFAGFGRRLCCALAGTCVGSWCGRLWCLGELLACVEVGTGRPGSYTTGPAAPCMA